MTAQPRFGRTLAEVLRIALPLMVSTGTLSLVLFADRTLLLWYDDGAGMSAAMAAGNLFWTFVCIPVGIASMTGAIVAQYVGSGRRRQVGRFLWQSVWFTLAAVPLFALVAAAAPWMFRVSGQPPQLVALEASYMRVLMVGAAGIVLETALSGFFSGIQRTRIIMWASLATGLLNILLDVWLIFGGLGVPPLGIVGAGWASVISFWAKACIYAAILLGPAFQARYRIRRGCSWNPRLLGKLLYFGTPAGLQNLTEAGAFTFIILGIGRLGDLPLRATTMAINFNMIAFIPLIGVSIAASVMVGHRLTSSGAAAAIAVTRSALAIGLAYSFLWACLYLLAPDLLLSLYRMGQTGQQSEQAIVMAKVLLRFVAVYVFLDSVQLILSGALRGAGDAWFVLVATMVASATAISVGLLGAEVLPPRLGISSLHWWWGVITAWVWLLAMLMAARYRHGRWQSLRMVS